jgi:hypothetical protein
MPLDFSSTELFFIIVLIIRVLIFVIRNNEIKKVTHFLLKRGVKKPFLSYLNKKVVK